MKIDERAIRDLNQYCKTYDTINKAIVSTKNRIQAICPDAVNGEERDFSNDEVIASLTKIKSQVSRRIEKELGIWPEWSAWMAKINGIGPFIGGNLILLFKYKFMPICPKCETEIDKKDGTYFCSKCDKSIKGDGNLTFKIKEKDFPTVSKWWAYMGKGIDPETGRVVRRQKGKQSNWSSKGKMICFMISDQFNRQNGDHLYKQFLLERKRIQSKKYPDYKKGVIHGMALNEVSKLFLSHFWHVSRTIDGKPTSGPWIEVHGGHDNIIPPYYWNGLV